jgi:fructose-1-phosphate kinase PfkB-like protein
VIEHGGRTTVLNEPGPELAPEDWSAFEAAVVGALDHHGVLVCSGSVPPGSPEHAYARLAGLAAGAGRPCIVDAAGGTLAHALAARPDVVCPNLAEAEAVLGGESGGQPVESAPDARPRAEAAAAQLVARGACAAIVTADAAGAALAATDRPPVWLPAPPIATLRNPIGAGDVLACALAAALERGSPLLDAARHGVAAAAASVESPTAGELDARRASELLAAVVPA